MVIGSCILLKVVWYWIQHPQWLHHSRHTPTNYRSTNIRPSLAGNLTGWNTRNLGQQRRWQNYDITSISRCLHSSLPLPSTYPLSPLHVMAELHPLNHVWKLPSSYAHYKLPVKVYFNMTYLCNQYWCSHYSLIIFHSGDIIYSFKFFSFNFITHLPVVRSRNILPASGTFPCRSSSKHRIWWSLEGFSNESMIVYFLHVS